MSKEVNSQKIDNILRAAGYDRTDYDPTVVNEYLTSLPTGQQPYVVDINNPLLPDKIEYKRRREQLLDIRHALPYFTVETVPDKAIFYNLSDGIGVDVSIVNADFIRVTFGGYTGTALINFKGSANTQDGDTNTIIYSAPRIIFVGGVNSFNVEILGSGGYCSIEVWNGAL